MGTAGKEWHFKQKELSEQRSELGMGGGIDRWSCRVWQWHHSKASESRKGENKRQTAVYDSHGQVPFRKPAARSDSLQLQDLSYQVKPHRLLGSSQLMVHYGRDSRACPFLPKVGLLWWAIFVLDFSSDWLRRSQSCITV